MHDREDQEPSGFEGPDDRRAFDSKVRQALSAAQWISGWATDAIVAEGQAADGRMSVAWIRLIQPSDQLLASLQRLDRVHGHEGRWHLVLDSPIFAHPEVLHRWSTTAMSVLGKLLGSEASFLAVLVLGELPSA